VAFLVTGLLRAAKHRLVGAFVATERALDARAARLVTIGAPEVSMAL